MSRRIGLKARFICLILIIMTAMFTTIAVVLLQNNTSSLRENLQTRSKAFAALATTPVGNAYLTYHESGTVMITQQITSFKQLDDNITSIAVVDTTGRILYNPSGRSKPITAEQAQTFEPIYQYDKNNIISRIIYPFIETDGRHRYAVVYDVSSKSIDTALASLTQAIIIQALLGLAVSAIITYLLVNQIFLKPIKRLRDQAIVISSGHYDEQITAKRKDEIGDLARSVNQMADSLKADIHKLQEVDQIKSEFMMIASHNLRTPLMIINGYLDMAKTQALSGELRDLLSSIEANSQRLGIFAEDLLVISGIESGKKIFTPERIRIDDMLTAMSKDFKVLAKDKQLSFSSRIDDTGSEIDGSTPHLRGAIWNLLENALKFTPENGTIELSLTKVGDNLQISVKDSGIGISPDEMSRLFTKFHRGTSTLVYKYEGTGIGLYVTKLLINEHRGTVTVDSTPGKGSTFTITLPIATGTTETQSSDDS
jgi:signal transduction histidine kinase